MDPLNISVASLKWLTEAGHLTVSEASPFFAPLRASKHSPEQRQQAAKSELLAKGVSFDAGASPEGESYKESLAILAQPDGLLRLHVMLPELPVQSLGVMVRGGRGTRFTIDGETCGVSPAADLDDVAEAFAKDLTYEGPLAKQEVLFWPSALRLLSVLWQDSVDPAKVLSRKDVLTKMTGAASPEELEKILEDLVRTGFLEAKGDELRIPEGLQPWLGLAWSGHGFQVEYVPLKPGTSLEMALETTGAALVFLGPPGQRILNLPITGAGVAQRTQGGKPVEDKIVRLCTPAGEAMLKAFRVLLRLEAPAAAA